MNKIEVEFLDNSTKEDCRTEYVNLYYSNERDEAHLGCTYYTEDEVLKNVSKGHYQHIGILKLKIYKERS